MTSPLDMAAMQAGAGEQASRELQGQLGTAGNLHGRNVSPEVRAKKLREACEGFESIFIQKMWQEMRNAVPKGGMFQGREEKFWQDMYDHELSKSMTKAGGIGLADMMYAQLSRSLGEASKSTAEMTAGGAFAPGAAPLVPQAAPDDVLAPPASPEGRQAAGVQPAAQAGIYDGEAPQVGANAEDAARAAQTGPAGEQQASVQQATVQQVLGQQGAMGQAAGVQQAMAAQPARTDVAPQPVTARPAKAPSRASRRNGDNSLDLAQTAFREAGDKLGAGAVRPPLRQRRQSPAQPPENQAIEEPKPDTRPGTPEDLRRAIAAARGEQPASGESGTPLADMVARVKAAQNAALAQASPGQAANQEAFSQTAPQNQANIAPGQTQGTRRVTYTTNIPPAGPAARKGQKDAIRLLNVENAGPGSNAGKGIAAYHAQQAAAQAQTQAARPEAQAPASRPVQDGQGGYAIPSLTAGDLNDNV